MITITAHMDKTELASALDVPESELDKVCKGHVNEVLSRCEGDIESFMTEMIRNNDYDVALTASESLDHVLARHARAR